MMKTIEIWEAEAKNIQRGYVACNPDLTIEKMSASIIALISLIRKKDHALNALSKHAMEQGDILNIIALTDALEASEKEIK